MAGKDRAGKVNVELCVCVCVMVGKWIGRRWLGMSSGNSGGGMVDSEKCICFSLLDLKNGEISERPPLDGNGNSEVGGSVSEKWTCCRHPQPVSKDPPPLPHQC